MKFDKEAIALLIEEAIRGSGTHHDEDGIEAGPLDAIAIARGDKDLEYAADWLRDTAGDAADRVVAYLSQRHTDD